MLPVDPKRFLEDLHRLRRFGASGVGKGCLLYTSPSPRDS